MKIIQISIVLLFIAGCNTSNRQNIDEDNADVQINDQQSGNSNMDFIVIGDSVEIPAFEIQVELTQEASQKIEKLKETIIVKAFFSGIPIDKTIPEYAEFREFSVGDYGIKLVGDKRIASFTGVKIYKPLFDALEDENIEVLVNIYSGRTSTNVNLLDWEIFQGMIYDIKGKRYVLKGKLIE